MPSVLLAFDVFNCFQRLPFRHFGNAFIFCVTTKDCAGSEQRSHRCIYLLESSWKYESYRDYISVFTDGSRYWNSVVCASFSIKHHHFHDCLIQHPYLPLKSGQSLMPWKKKIILLHPNRLFLQTNFRVFKLYNP